MLLLLLLLLLFYSLWVLHRLTLVVFYWSLNDHKSPRVSGSFLSILVDLNNVLVWMVSILHLISNSTCLFSKLLGTVPSLFFFFNSTLTLKNVHYSARLLKMIVSCLFKEPNCRTTTHLINILISSDSWDCSKSLIYFSISIWFFNILSKHSVNGLTEFQQI